jgi:FGGY-family pentulose kinase/HAD superfamily hydrolase (TIGR01509 family)
MARHLCAVDVGTSSARVGIFDEHGRMAASAEHPVRIHRPAPDHAEHDSEDIWAAVCAATRAAVATAGIRGVDVAAIAFDATCSLVARDADGRPVSVSLTGEDRWDTIVWHDHRAVVEAELCTATGHAVLDRVGGVMSPEMQTPKLMWLKRHLPQAWARIRHLFDLADFLSWKASGSTARSQCTLGCKWAYLPHEAEPWARDHLAAVGLDDLAERGALPARAVAPGTDLGPLTETAAGELGLSTGCRVGAGLVDAYAGALALLGPFGRKPSELDRRAALIAGTSSCLMIASPRPVAFAGSWGPYFGVTLPDLWVTEGGQSASGALLDHVVRLHRAGGEPTADLVGRVIHRIGDLRARDGAAFAERLHVLPDFHGNRSPLADPRALGVISGLDVDASFDGLCALYWRTAVALALGVRHILEAIRTGGRTIDTLHLTGGHARNPLLLELYGDVTGCDVVTTGEDNAMLRGTAMLAACAAGLHAGPQAAAAAMGVGHTVRPPDRRAGRRYDVDYEIFLALHAHRRAVDRLVERRGSVERAAALLSGRRLVIFDCDGVVVDSEPIALAVLKAHIEDHGATVDDAELAARTLGRSAAEAYAAIHEAWGVRIDEADAAHLQERLFARFRSELTAIPGVGRLLDRLAARGIAHCLASSSSPHRLDVALSAVDLADRFAGRVFSATMVARGKPAPDLFLHAARTLGVDPADCLVIEDSAVGIEAAQRAGMAVVGFLGGGHATGTGYEARLRAARPNAMATSFEELVDLVE